MSSSTPLDDIFQKTSLPAQPTQSVAPPASPAEIPSPKVAKVNAKGTEALKSITPATHAAPIGLNKIMPVEVDHPLVKNGGIELEDKEDASTNFPEDEIDAVSPETTRDTLFEGCSLEIYEDTYKGNLPKDGIRKSDFPKLKELYNDIVNDRGFFTIEGGKEFTSSIKGILKDVLMMKTGRTLLLGLLENDNKILIRKADKSLISFDDLKKCLVVDFDLSDNTYIQTILPDGSKELVKTTPLIDLLHELNHGLIELGEIYAPLQGKDKKEYFDRGEFRNITGNTADPSEADFQKLIRKTKDQFTSAQQKEHKELEDVSEFSKWKNLRSTSEEALAKELSSYEAARIPGGKIITYENLFRHELKLPMRDGHFGLKKPTDLKISTPEMTAEIGKYFNDICTHGYIKEIKEFLDINHDLIDKPIMIKAINIALINCVTDKNLDGLKAMIKFGLISINHQVPPSDVKLSNINLLELTSASGFADGVSYLLTMPSADKLINTITEKGDSLLHVVVYGNSSQSEITKIIELLISKGLRVDPAFLNNIVRNLLLTGHTERLKGLIQSGLITQEASTKILNLILFENKGSVKAIKQLIESGTFSIRSIIESKTFQFLVEEGFFIEIEYLFRLPDAKNIFQLLIENSSVKEIEFIFLIPIAKKYFKEIISGGDTTFFDSAMKIADTHGVERNRILEILLTNSVDTDTPPIKIAMERNLPDIFSLLLSNLDSIQSLKLLKEVIDSPNSKYLEIFINKGIPKNILPEATIYITSNGDKEKLHLFFKYLAKFDKTLLLTKDTLNNNLLHKLLKNRELEKDAMARLALFLMNNKVSPFEENNEEDGDSFHDLCPTEVYEKIKQMKEKQVKKMGDS